MNEPVKKWWRTRVWLPLTTLTLVAELNVIGITASEDIFVLSSLIYVLIDILTVFYLYFSLPKNIVTSYPKRYFKSDPNWLYFVEKGTVIARAIPGQNWVLAGNDLNSAADMEIRERKYDSQDTGGGERDFIIRVLEDWIFRVAGYRVVALTFTDLWNAEVKIYDLGRDKVLKDYAGKTPDLSNHIVLAPQIYPFKAIEMETTKLVKSEGSQDQRERIPVDMEVNFAFQVTNALHITRGTNWKYFPFVFSVLETAILNSIKKHQLGYDDVISDAGKEKISAYVIEQNDAGYILPGETSGPSKAGGIDEKYGFKFTELLIGNATAAKSYTAALEAQQKARLETEAQITAATLGVTLAEKKLQIAKLDAEAAIAPEKLELQVLNESMRAMRAEKGLGSEDATTLLVAREERKGNAALGAFKGDTLVISKGGQAPLQTIPIGGGKRGGGDANGEGAK